MQARPLALSAQLDNKTGSENSRDEDPQTWGCGLRVPFKPADYDVAEPVSQSVPKKQSADGQQRRNCKHNNDRGEPD